MVDRVLPTVRYVSVEGPVTRMIPGTDELLREMTVRYLAPEKIPGYLKFARELGEHVAIYLRPQRWLSSDMGPG
jgi:hypothetical protein